jgi:hypothetical protein
MFLLTKSLRGLLLTVLVSLVSISGAHAQADSWAVAQRDEAGILKVVGATQKFADQVPGGEGAAAVILYKEHNFRVQEDGNQHCINMIFLVQDPAAVEYLTAPWIEEMKKNSERASFRVRGDEVQRYDEGKSEFLPAVDDQHLARVRFEYEDLQKGDVLGWSVVLETSGPLFARRIAAADRFPVVYSSCRIFNDGQNDFELSALGVDEADAKAKTTGLVNDRPEKWSLNLKMLAAVEDLPLDSPFPLGTPVFNIAMIERYLEIEGFYTGWVPTTGMVNTAAFLSAGRERMIKDGGGVDVHASALTTGLTEPEEKEQAVFDFVRDSIALIDEDGYNLGDLRPAKEILKSKQGTELEKVSLMIAMLDAVGVTAELGAARPESWGPLSDLEEVNLTSFYTQVVRCGKDLGRIYVPQCADCEAGAVPPAWGAAEVISPKPGLTADLQAYNEEIRTKAYADAGRMDMREIQMEAEAHGEKEGWYRVDTVAVQ